MITSFMPKNGHLAVWKMQLKAIAKKSKEAKLGVYAYKQVEKRMATRKKEVTKQITKYEKKSKTHRLKDKTWVKKRKK